MVNLKDALIVGIDPGMTTGVAILDANGNILDIYSERDITRSEIIRHIMRFGRPIVVASDVSETPKSVERIGVKLGCAVYSPENLLSVNEKRELTKEHYQSLKNNHEIDALAAAIKAWKNYRKLFSKIKDVLHNFDRQELFVDVALKILKEESTNIEEAVREFIQKEKTPFDVISNKINHNELVLKLDSRLAGKQKEIESLQRENILLSRALNETKRKLGKDTGIVKEDLTEDYLQMRNSLDYIKDLRRVENKGHYPVIELDRITGDLLDEINEKIDLEGRVVMTENKDNLNLLNSRNIKCLLTTEELNEREIKNLEFPVLHIDEKVVESFGDIKGVKIDYIEKGVAEARKSGLVEWLKDYRKRKN